MEEDLRQPCLGPDLQEEYKKPPGSDPQILMGFSPTSRLDCKMKEAEKTLLLSGPRLSSA